MSLKDKIKESQDIQTELITVEEWGVQIQVKTMSAKARAKLFSTATDKQGNVIHEKFQAAMVITCCFDPETGEKLFSEADTEWLMEKSAGPIEQIASVAMRLSGLTKEVAKALEKNS